MRQRGLNVKKEYDTLVSLTILFYDKCIFNENILVSDSDINVFEIYRMYIIKKIYKHVYYSLMFYLCLNMRCFIREPVDR